MPHSRSLQRRTILAGALASVAVGAAPIRAQTPSLKKVRVSQLPIADYVPVRYGMAQDWFKQAGLDISIEATAAGGIAMQALIAGKLDMIFTSLDVVLRARAQRFNVVIVSDNNNVHQQPPDGTAIMAHGDSGIKSAKDLEGKRVLVNNLQNVDWAYCREAIAKAGGDTKKVQFLEVDFPLMLDSLKGGRADAACATEPFVTIGKSMGFKVVSYMFAEVQPGLNLAGWVANADWVKDNHDEALAFRRVLQKAMDVLNSNPEEKIKTIVQFTSLKPDLANKITVDVWTTKLDPGDLQKQLEVYKRQGLIDNIYDAKSVIVP